ncbi:hypothetical protein BRD05_09030 [Halobacteriales archaeon QS_9_70_65]|nr:MAG: hypothetical protein BRD05_09030 [Halobacteriales archaeon QS_9_70_65]
MCDSLAVGVAGHPVGLRVDLPVVALAVYRTGVLGFVGVRKDSSATPYDERHERLEARSAPTTLRLGAFSWRSRRPPPALAEHFDCRIEGVFAPE